MLATGAETIVPGLGRWPPADKLAVRHEAAIHIAVINDRL